MALSQISKHANHFSEIENHSRYDGEGHCDLFVDKGLWVVQIFKLLVHNIYSEWRRISGISREQSAIVSSLKVVSFIWESHKNEIEQKWDCALDWEWECERASCIFSIERVSPPLQVSWREIQTFVCCFSSPLPLFFSSTKRICRLVAAGTFWFLDCPTS